MTHVIYCVGVRQNGRVFQPDMHGPMKRSVKLLLSSNRRSLDSFQRTHAVKCNHSTYEKNNFTTACFEFLKLDQLWTEIASTEIFKPADFFAYRRPMPRFPSTFTFIGLANAHNCFCITGIFARSFVFDLKLKWKCFCAFYTFRRV